MAKSEDTLKPPVIFNSISKLCSSKYFLALYKAYIVGTEVESLIILGLAAVAPPRPSIVIKSGLA